MPVSERRRRTVVVWTLILVAALVELAGRVNSTSGFVERVRRDLKRWVVKNDRSRWRSLREL